LHFIINVQKAHIKGKRVVLTSKFHVIIKVLLKVIKVVKADTITHVKNKAIKKGKRVVEEGSSNDEVNHDLLNEDRSDYKNYIIVKQ
jgi:hypothetical protein